MFPLIRCVSGASSVNLSSGSQNLQAIAGESYGKAEAANLSRFVETAVASVWMGATLALLIYVLVIATLGSCWGFDLLGFGIRIQRLQSFSDGLYCGSFVELLCFDFGIRTVPKPEVERMEA